ncbi:15371_t:CDS:2 [Funneliformis geosporum]|nr:15371_t:CDS:2 [Funneliformis geosporum]
MTSLKEWIDTKIKDGDITHFEYAELSELKVIGKGGFGIVHRADLVSRGIQVALKSFSNNDAKIDKNDVADLVKELKLLRIVHYHPNINHFIGITYDDGGNYKMILEYANGGNLRDYLGNKRNFISLQWKDKIRMALDITSGLMCLHKDNIIHRDLHSKNILVHNNRLMIADLGLSKKITEVTTTSKFEGMAEYIDPQCYIIDKYIRDKKSDIYSLGVLLWEITSGRPPFSNFDNRFTLIYQLINSQIRESPEENTPLKYQQLYQKCWNQNPAIRPDINEVYARLKQLDAQFNGVDSDDFIINEERESSEALIEISKVYIIHNDTGPTKSLDFDRIIESHRPKSRAIFDYLINNPTIDHYDVMIGIFHYHYSESEKYEKFYQCVMKASENDDIYGHFELGRCYYHGYGTEIDSNKAIELFERSGLNIALYRLADHHNQCGNLQEAFELYTRSAEKGYVISQQIVGEFYYSGRVPQKDHEIALKWYKKYQNGGGINDVEERIKDIDDYLNKMHLAIGVFNFLTKKFIRP